MSGRLLATSEQSVPPCLDGWFAVLRLHGVETLRERQTDDQIAVDRSVVRQRRVTGQRPDHPVDASDEGRGEGCCELRGRLAVVGWDHDSRLSVSGRVSQKERG